MIAAVATSGQRPEQAEAEVAAAAGREAKPQAERRRWLSLILVGLVAYRVAYHATYLGEVPFAHGTFSDGAVYEAAALDILAAPPLGTEPFYLQGAYAYLLALGMAIRAWASVGLMIQLLLAALGLFVFHRAALRLWGPTAGRVASIALLAHPGLAFYENKYLSAELGVVANILVIAAFVGLLVCERRDPEPANPTRSLSLRAALLGAAVGLAILARPNMILALPFALVAVFVLLRARGGRVAGPAVAATLLGCLLALAPMAGRNLAVTGHPDIQPVHGGGTSFYIGNNPKSRGVWNDADLLSARLGTESRELAVALDIDPELPERARARAIGDALYGRAFAWIAEHPGDFLWLELRKLWLTIGDDQLSQDYDWLGERELIPWAHRIGLSFSLLMALAVLGSAALARGRWRPGTGIEGDPAEPAPAFPDTQARRRALAWLLAGLLLAPLAANLLFFTSAQHRLPLVIPLALLSGPGLVILVATIRARLQRDRPRPVALPVIAWILAVLAAAQGPWPRNKRDQPSPVHYYNLAMVQDQIGEPKDALASLDRAIELRPGQPIFHMRRAHLRLRLDDLDGVDEDLAVVFEAAEAAEAEGRPLPGWVLHQAKLDRSSVAHERRLRGGADR